MKLYNELSSEQIETAKKFLAPFKAEQFLPQVLMNMMGDLNPGEVLILLGGIAQLAYSAGISNYAAVLNARLKLHEKPLIDQIDESRMNAGI